MHDVVDGPDRQIHSILRTHHAQVGDQVPATSSQCWIRWSWPQSVGVRTSSDHGHVFGPLPATRASRPTI